MKFMQSIEVKHLDVAINTLQDYMKDHLRDFNEFRKLLSDTAKGALEIKEGCPFAYLNEQNGVVGVVNFSFNYTLTGNAVFAPDEQKEKITKLVSKGIPDTVWDVDRARKALLLKTATYTIETFINTYTTHKLSANEVNIIAALIRNRKNKYEMIICEKPEDYVTMFSVMNNSCMNMEGRYGSGEHPKWKQMAKDHGWHPGSWYHFTKTSKGFYIVDEAKTPIARGMLYRDDKGNFSKYGDIKIMGSITYTLIYGLLVAYGYTTSGCAWSCTEEFRVPAVIDKDGVRWCPMPYGDNCCAASIAEAFDPNTDEFVFKPWIYDEKVFSQVATMYSHRGWATSDKFRQLPIIEKKAA